MRIDMLDCGRIILIFGAAGALFQELWYVDNKFDLSLPIFFTPIIIMITGIIIMVWAHRRNK
jgi:hypothetical protein